MQTTIQKWGIAWRAHPKGIVKEAHVAYGTQVICLLDDGKIVIDPRAEPEYRLEDLLKGVTKRNLHAEVLRAGRRAGGVVMAASYCPKRETWLDILQPQAGHEQAGHRPALVSLAGSVQPKGGVGAPVPHYKSGQGYPFEVRVPDGLKAAGPFCPIRSKAWIGRRARHCFSVPSGIHREASVEQAWHIARLRERSEGADNRLDRNKPDAQQTAPGYFAPLKTHSLVTSAASQKGHSLRRREERTYANEKTSPRVWYTMSLQTWRILTCGRAALHCGRILPHSRARVDLLG